MKQCRKCGNALIIQHMKKVPKLKRRYFYTQWNYCPKCKTQYFELKYSLMMNPKNLEYAKLLVQQERQMAKLKRLNKNSTDDFL